MTPEFNFPHRVHTIGVEAIDGRLSGDQSMGRDPQMLHDPAGA